MPQSVPMQKKGRNAHVPRTLCHLLPRRRPCRHAAAREPATHHAGNGQPPDARRAPLLHGAVRHGQGVPAQPHGRGGLRAAAPVRGGRLLHLAGGRTRRNALPVQLHPARRGGRRARVRPLGAGGYADPPPAARGRGAPALQRRPAGGAAGRPLPDAGGPFGGRPPRRALPRDRRQPPPQQHALHGSARGLPAGAREPLGDRLFAALPERGAAWRGADGL